MIETTETVEALAETSETINTTKTTTATEKQGFGNDWSFTFLLANIFCFMISTIIVKSFWEFEDAPSALAFYGVYHRYGWNQVIHFFGVPGIIWSLLVFFVHVPLPWIGSVSVSGSGSTKTTTISPINYAAFLVVCYNLFYLSIDRFGAVLYSPVLYLMYTSAVSLVEADQVEAAEAYRKQVTGKNDNTSKGGFGTATTTTNRWYGTGKILKLALVVHVLCWYLQIHLGHKLIEGAQPAVLQSLGGALSVAPLFAFYEGLWFLGINQNLQQSTVQLVAEHTLKLCTERGIDAMKACSSVLLQE